MEVRAPDATHKRVERLLEELRTRCVRRVHRCDELINKGDGDSSGLELVCMAEVVEQWFSKQVYWASEWDDWGIEVFATRAGQDEVADMLRQLRESATEAG